MINDKDNSGFDAENVNGNISIPAAQYVRMSTDHQKYSTENQCDMIKDYAEIHGMTIIRTYADEGKSGLNLEGRDGLKHLIETVESGMADFKVILAYDISRWGRFQDADESAYYEYICKRAGITVQYCAEQFENDGSPVSTIVKGVKRAMAGEYSRELSAKVFKGQCKLIELGFRQGGPAGFGLRRMLVDQHDNHRRILNRGEYKSLQTDRVILVKGPLQEVKTVRRIYEMFVNNGKLEKEIADILNETKILTDLDRQWSRGTIHQILTNEKYIGNNVYNRNSFKLKKTRVRNPPEMWVRSDQAFEGIVDPEMFYSARGIIMERNRRYSDEEMLDLLKKLLNRHGRLCGLLINETEKMPSSSSYNGRFGSLIRAYSMIGYTPERDYQYIEINRFLRKTYSQVITEVITIIEDMGCTIKKDEKTDILTINSEFTASIVIVRCKKTKAGSLRWITRLDSGHDPDITVVLRMYPSNNEVMDYYLIPLIDVTIKKLLLAEENGAFLDAYHFDTLDFFFGMAKRIKIEVAA